MGSLPCPQAQWTRFSALLDEAMDLPAEARAAWLADLSGEDLSLRPSLARVLGGDQATGTDFLAPFAALTGFDAGATVGSYRLIAPLGEGGMGEVWRARRVDDGPQRDVALKLPHADLLSGRLRQRFARERDVLAALSHPHIAQLFDAGLSADGHPYLALELVEGQPITDACRAAGASLNQRLDLVRQVLDALSYAHRRLIVHRDIKPSNVLVTADGGVKLLDFGIAKLLQPSEQQDAALTQPAARLATPAYAAPEQLGAGAITVAADLFSTGVLLFELCTGHRPFLTPPIGPTALPAPLASQRADADAAGLPDGKRLARRLRGDIDAVIAQALALEPEKRYSSAEAFARDLRRCRDGLPVSARRIGWPVRAAKFAARNKVGVGLALVLAVALAGGTGGISWQAHRAEREAARATAIKDFLIGLFKEGDPRGGRARNDALTARQLLDIGADRADASFTGDPATEIELLGALGDIYDVQDDSARAERVWTRRLELASKLYGPSDPLVVDGAIALANSEAEALNTDKAKALLEQVRGPILRRYGDHSVQYAEWLANRARALRATHGGSDEIIADTQAAIGIFASVAPDSNDYIYALTMLSFAQNAAERHAESLATCRTMHAVAMAHAAPDAMHELMYMNCAARQLQQLGRLSEAEALYTQSEAQAARTIGRQSEWYLIPALRHAEMVHLHGERARADVMFAAAMSGNEASAPVQIYYGAALSREGRAAEAVPLLEAALAEARLHIRDEDKFRTVEGVLGDAYDQVGRTAEARGLLLASRDEWIRFGVAHGPATLGARERWARFLLDHGEGTAAAAEFRAVLALAEGPLAPASLAASGLARIALAHHDLAVADSMSARATDILGSATLQYDVRARVDVWRTRAEVLLAVGRIAEARAWAQKAVSAAEAFDAPASPRLARARMTAARVQSVAAAPRN
jgi:serine/threonine-protein kinase